MIAYLSKRIFSLMPVLVGITIFAFLIGVASPGDPSYMALTRDGISDPTEEEIQEKRHELGLDLPLHIQYVNWTNGILKGDLGTSIYTGESIGEELKRRLPVTFKLAVTALIVTVTTGLSLGALMARFRYTLLDKVLRQIATLIVSVPSFWMAIILITIFSEWLQILPTSGNDGPLSFVLPSVVLSLGSIGVSSRLARANFIGELNKQYVLIAHAKGLKGRTIGCTHIFRNALIPLVTFFGMFFASILGGASVIETIFALPGLGSYVVEGVFSRDYFVIQAYVLLTGTIYVTMNLIIDLLYFVINPQIRQGEGL
jgi:peptide/nickel transport system permease protein